MDDHLHWRAAQYSVSESTDYHYEQQRSSLVAQLGPAREDAARFVKLAALDAEPRSTAQAAHLRANALDDQLTALSLSYSASAAQARARAESLALDVQTLQGKRARVAAAQVVRSPVAGRIAQITVKDATQAGVVVDVVIVSTLADAQPVKALGSY